MIAAVFVYSRSGTDTAGKVLRFFEKDQVRAYAPERICCGGFAPIPVPSAPLYGSAFAESDALIFIGSCGIAVREIAPFVRNKISDPAVICIDAAGRFVIPLLSGHIGGANELAKRLAAVLDAQPVITTATDIYRRFSVDSWAAKAGFAIDSMKAAKDISAAILETDIPILCELPAASAFPPGTFPEDHGPLGIYIGWEKKTPFGETLRIIPPVLTLGIGCCKGISKEAVALAVETVLTQNGIDRRALRSAGSIDLKAEEQGLLEYCRDENLPIVFYPADVLRKVNGDFSHSDFVEQVTGVDNVCERAAMVGADRLIVRKTACCGVTVAVSAVFQEVDFE